jgi:hypothetical protein
MAVGFGVLETFPARDCWAALFGARKIPEGVRFAAAVLVVSDEAYVIAEERDAS